MLSWLDSRKDTTNFYVDGSAIGNFGGVDLVRSGDWIIHFYIIKKKIIRNTNGIILKWNSKFAIYF